MLLRKTQIHPFDLDPAQIDIGLILDKKEKAVHPSAAKLLAFKKDQQPETTMSVSSQSLSASQAVSNLHHFYCKN